MKRLYMVAAVLGLWSCAAGAQEGLAPTVPVVPAPVLQNGKVVTPPGGGWGRSDSRPFATSQWSPFRNPATASVVQPASSAAVVPQLPLPTGVSTPDAANCGPGGCASGGRNRSCWSKLKAFLCYHDSPTDAPKCRPTPYITPLIGMFPCTPVGSAGCASGGCATSAPTPAHYAPTTTGYNAPPMMPPPGVGRAPQASPSAGAVAMPARGAPAPVQPTWQGRVTPEGPIVPTGYKYPVPNK